MKTGKENLASGIVGGLDGDPLANYFYSSARNKPEVSETVRYFLLSPLRALPSATREKHLSS